MSKTKWTGRPDQLNRIWTDRGDISEYRQEMLRLIERDLQVHPDNIVVDCGCGTGLVYNYLDPELRGRYRGFDFTNDMVNYCIEKFPEAMEQFDQADLTKPNIRKIKGDLLITQNVVQHILLWQLAIDNIMRNATHGVIFCERTHKGQTLIAGYEPAVRWRFNIKDFYDTLVYFKEKYGYRGRVEIIGHPLTTFDEPDCLTIFRVIRDEAPEPETLIMSDFDYEPLSIDTKNCRQVILGKIKAIVGRFDLFS